MLKRKMLLFAAAAWTTAATAAEKAPDAQLDWRYAAVLQPIDLINSLFPAAELQFQLQNEPRRPTSIALAYWGSRSSTYYGDSYRYSFGSESAASEPRSRDVKKQMSILTARYKLYLLRSFHFNAGAGFRQTMTQEAAVFNAGDRISVTKRAVDVGGEVGLGNRWVLKNHLVIGGNWLQVYVPLATVSHKDAAIPAGYTAKNNASDRKKVAFRLAAFDIGYAW